MNREIQFTNGFVFFFEISFALLIFYGFLQWHEITDWQGKVLLLFIYILIINDWLASRSGNVLTSIALAIFTLFDLFLFTNMLISLKSGVSGLGYQPSFWIFISLLSLSYAMWNFLAATIVSKAPRKVLRKWGTLMLVCFLICLSTYFGLTNLLLKLSLSPNIQIYTSLVVSPVLIYWIVVLSIWTSQLYSFSQALAAASSKANT